MFNATSRLSVIMASIFAIALATASASANPQCTLTANPTVVPMNRSVTLTLSGSSGAYSGYIDWVKVPAPRGIVTVTPIAVGVVPVQGMVLYPEGEGFCETEYEVVPAELATIVGDVVSATTGRALSGVSINLTPHGLTAASNNSGAFSFASVPLGGYMLTASLSGYTTETYNGVAVSGQNPPVHLVLNPILPTNQLRVVLVWGATPSDLDSHMFTRHLSGETAHVYYSNKTGLNTTLDVDDTSSYGPETVTLLDWTAGRYTYAVFDYTNRDSSGQVATSEAVVKVYRGSNQIAEFKPTNSGTETTWHVFDVDIGADGSFALTPRNQYSNINLDRQNTFP